MKLKVYLRQMKDLFKYYQSYDRELAGICYSLCEYLCQSLSFKGISELNNLISALFNVVPVPHYQVRLKFMVLYSEFLYEYRNMERLTEREILEVDYYILLNNFYESYLLSSSGLPGEAYNFQLNSYRPFLLDDNKYNIDFDRLENVIDYLPYSREIIIDLFSNQFYLSKILGHDKLQSNDIFRKSRHWIRMGEEATAEDVRYLLFYGDLLAHSNTRDQGLLTNIVSELKTQFLIEYQRKPDMASLIAQTLSGTLGKVSCESMTDWARKALAVPNAKIIPQCKISLNLTLLINEDTLDKHAVIIAFEEFLRYLESTYSSIDLITSILQRHRLSQFPIMVIIKALKDKEHEFAVYCAFIWHTYSGQTPISTINRKTEAILLIMPAYEATKTVYILVHDKVVKHLEANSLMTTQEFLSLKNEVEQNWTILLDSSLPRPRPELIEGMAINLSKGELYLHALEQYLLPDDICNFIKESNISKVRVLELACLNIPIISLLASKTGLPFSSIVTNQPLPESPITKVLIWCDPDSTLFGADLEREAIEQILDGKQIDFQSFSASSCSLELFLDLYRDSDIDLIWIMSHGNFNFDDPTESSIVVSDQKSVTVRELLENNINRDARRLLVLNTCQSATSSVRYNSMGIGFAQILTTPSQSVLGHLWPVSSFAASIFGCLLIEEISSGHSWSKANVLAQNQVKMGRQSLIERLESLLNEDTQLLTSVKYRSEQYDNILVWGSSMLFE